MTHPAWLVIALFLAFYAAPLTACAAGERQEFKKGVSAASIRLGNNQTVSVSIKTTSYPERVPYQPELFWGGVSTPPRSVIAVVVVEVAGSRIHVPYSAFGDLGEPRDVLLTSDDWTNFSITLRGGDAGGSYEAHLRFEYDQVQKRHLLRRRKVLHGEFPSEVWEETTYSWISASYGL